MVTSISLCVLQFVSNALYDMGIKKKKQQEELMSELEGSAFLVKKAQMEMGKQMTE